MELAKHPVIYLQCKEGHLMCNDCFNNPNFVDKRCCICRISMENPSRNRLAEKQVKNMSVICKVEGCNVELPYYKMKQHVDNDCQAVQVQCKYMTLGCNWSGPRRNAANHSHSGIDYDSLVEKIEELCEETSNLEDELYECNEEFSEFQELIMSSNISETFDLKQIWQDFDLEAFSEIQQVHRFCGDNKKAIQTILHFRINLPESLDENTPIRMNCKISVQCLTPQTDRELKAIVRFAPAQHTRGIWSQTEESLIRANFNLHFQSDWFPLLEFDVDFIETANRIVLGQDAGSVKVFAKI